LEKNPIHPPYCYLRRVIHFAFLDRAIGYDCVRCGSRCCRGLGFGLGGAELVPLLGRAPALAPFMQLSPTGVNAFTLTDGCWALAEDGRCSLEIGHGRAAKPSICRLFPLRLQRVGTDLVVDLQLLSCPLEPARAISAGPGRTVLSHDELRAEVEADGLAAFALEVRIAAGAPNDLLAREAAIRDQTAVDLAASDPLDVVGGAREELAAMRAGWRRFFGLGDDEAAALDRRVTPSLALALPLLRWSALTAPGAPPYPRLASRLPARLLAGALWAAFSVRAGRPPSLRTLAELWRGTPLVREALCRWHAVATPNGAPPSGTPPELAAAFAEVQRSGRPLGEALEALTPALAPPLRPLLIRLIADRL
jgi:hypothetical protein